MNFMISWLILRMEWVYGFVTRTMHLPSFIGFIVLALLVVIFFYDLYDIFRQRAKSVQALICLFIVLVVPLGTLIYLIVGKPYLRKYHLPIEQTVPLEASPDGQPIPQNQPIQTDPMGQPIGQSYNTSNISNIKGPTTILGTIVGAIAIIAGAVTVVIFAIIIIAIIQCQNDPKCM